MKVNEIFFSIQGEGIFQGLPTIFLRLTGCNLRCNYCDTSYAYNEGSEETIQEIIQKIKKYNCRRICITGGEPLLQKEVLKLIDLLKEYEISMETNGSLDISPYIDKAVISLDVKCPSSGCEDSIKLSNLNLVTKKDQVKFIVENELDFNYALKIIKKYELTKRTTVVFIPVYGTNYSNIVDLILSEGLDVRFGMQIHKFIWSPKRRGV